ncbi:MAG: YbdK family carboxylate-amine ligase [Mariprofundaceae bacterium]
MGKSSLQTIPFSPSSLGTLGVEMEWSLIDSRSGEQIPLAPEILNIVGDTPRIKQELFTSTIEINTDIHHFSADAIRELADHYQTIQQILKPKGADLFSTGTHPFSKWREQKVSDDPRYQRLFERLQWVAKRFNIFGLHVHIGMPNGDQCIHAMNQLLPIMPVFLALSANSPFWQGMDTGLKSSRIKIFEGLSQGGMPFYFEDWKDFEHSAARLLATESIDSVRDIWWEMRPHPDFGTLEVRIGDMPATRSDTLAYVAYVRAETMAAAHNKSPRVHPSLIRENRWRACRYGMEATIIDPETEELTPVLDWLQQRLEILAKLGADDDDLQWVSRQIPFWRKIGDGAMRQRMLYNKSGDFVAMIDSMHHQDEWDYEYYT